MPFVDHRALAASATALLRHAGLTDADATLLADSLVETSLMGIDSHGIARLGHYLNRLRRGSLKARPAIRPVAQDGGLAILDGDDGQGIIVAHAALDLALTLARAHGIGLVSVKNSSHCGAIGLYTRRAARDGFLGIACTHSDAFVAPPGGRSAFHGTNPLSIAVPSHAGTVCVDMATSQITLNSIMNARRTGTPLPTECLDSAGRPTRDPQQAVTLPPLGGHKGFALGFLIEILCGALVNQAMGPRVSRMYEDLDRPRKLGALLIAVDLSRLIDLGRFKDNVQQFLDDHKAQHPDIALYPGEPEDRKKRERLATGIPLDEPLRAELDALLVAAGLSALPA